MATAATVGVLVALICILRDAITALLRDVYVSRIKECPVSRSFCYRSADGSLFTKPRPDKIARIVLKQLC